MISNQDDYLIVLCTCPDLKIAEELGFMITRSKLAACVNIIPGITSIFTWQEKIETSSEVLLLIKTKQEAYHVLEAAIVKAHPYECPEVVAIPFSLGLAGYLQWLNNTVSVEHSHTY